MELLTYLKNLQFFKVYLYNVLDSQYNTSFIDIKINFTRSSVTTEIIVPKIHQSIKKELRSCVIKCYYKFFGNKIPYQMEINIKNTSNQLNYPKGIYLAYLKNLKNKAKRYFQVEGIPLGNNLEGYILRVNGKTGAARSNSRTVTVGKVLRGTKGVSMSQYVGRVGSTLGEFGVKVITLNKQKLAGPKLKFNY